jgi:lipopolysaccharide/colanic/teichoic acid biosynthesis glycosyltransferase
MSHQMRSVRRPAVRGAQPKLFWHVQNESLLRQMRRLGDCVIASFFLALIAPLMLIAALIIKLESAGPVLERRECIGRGGRRFQRLEFRTTMHDPRHATPAWARQTTQAGQFLRHTRIEDLPQLINVLRGEMSIINGDARSPSLFD